ncbi:MAG: complex I NDUFA9 subunit family protein [Termitinemataceae bacterium]|nr:MAG: complex I NDUFA9 subunit family protein [Termitinemataceae bacterium]
MNILIFGAAGFLGRCILKKLISYTHDGSVSLITAVTHKHPLPQELRSEAIREIRFDDFKKSTGEPAYDAAICLTGQTMGKEFKNFKEFKESNLDTPKYIINYCHSHSIKHLIYASSINVRLSNAKYYAEYKREIEDYIVKSGVPHTIFRPALIFGNTDTGLSRIYNFIEKYPFVPVFGDGKKLEQPIHVEEAAEFFCKAALSPPENKIYDIGGLKAYTYDELMRTMARTLGKKTAVIHLSACPIYLLLRFLESLKIVLPLSAEQILHIDTDLDIDNEPALNKYNVSLRPFEEWIRTYKKTRKIV